MARTTMLALAATLSLLSLSATAVPLQSSDYVGPDSAARTNMSNVLAPAVNATKGMPLAGSSFANSSDLPALNQAIPLTKKGVPVTSSDGSVNFDSLQVHLTMVKAKYQSGIVSYLRNTGQSIGSILPDGTAPEEGRRRRKRQTGSTGSVPLKDYDNDLLWAGPVSVGDPPQQFIINFDTGSADFWIPSTSCDSSSCGSGNKYDPTLSTSSKQQKGTFAIFYGDGSSTSGPIYTETVSISGLQVKNQLFSPVDQLSDGFANDPEDGILGLAFSTISAMRAKPVFRSMLEQNVVSSSQFGFRLAKPSQGESELFLGGTNPKFYTGSIEWHAVPRRAYFNITGVPTVNGYAMGERGAVIDTGTTVIVAPEAEAKAFWAQVPGSAPYSGAEGYYTFPCSSVPTVSFQFGSGQAWPVSAQNFNLGRVRRGSSTCVGAVVGLDVGLDGTTWILGDTFLKGVYSAFDISNQAVGFGKLK